MRNDSESYNSCLHPKHHTRIRGRGAHGSAIAEMGPALFVLLLLIFFPLLDLVGMTVSYSACVYLNFMQTKEASVVPKAEASSPNGQVQKGVVDAWLHTGFGQFAKIKGNPETEVSYRDGAQDGNTKVTDKIVRVVTRVSCEPFLIIPFTPGVPGLSAPMDFTISSEALMENPDHAT